MLDAVLKVDTPNGPCWRRYNHDGYGQREDGGPFVGYGKGRAWPLLTGERGYYELAAGQAPGPYLRALEGSMLRIQAGAPFLLHWTRDNWGTAEDSHSSPTALGIEYLDIATPPKGSGPIRFTFFWTDAGCWEGRDFEVAVRGS